MTWGFSFSGCVWIRFRMATVLLSVCQPRTAVSCQKESEDLELSTEFMNEE